MKTFVFDIETEPLPEAEIAAMIPPFDPAEVKTGNLKDPDKIAAKLAEAEASHRRDFIERAALDPLTGRVLAVGILDVSTSEILVLGHDSEVEILKQFWAFCGEHAGQPCQFIGFNSSAFDLPFLMRRSWKHGIVPHGIRQGRYWNSQFVDLREAWQLGDRTAKGSLDAISRHLGLGAKNGSGKDFAPLWHSDRQKALEYLWNDLHLTAKVAAALGYTQPAAGPVMAY